AADLRVLADLCRCLGLDRARIQTELVEDWDDDPALLPKERDQQVFRRDLGVPCAAREALRLDHSLLRLDRKLVEIHGLPHVESNRLNFNRQKLPRIPCVQEERANALALAARLTQHRAGGGWEVASP